MVVLASISFTISLSSALSAQSITDPQTVEFTPSPDHWATAADGSAIVTEYNLEIFEVGSSQSYQVVSIGKPQPDPDGKVRVSLAAVLPSWPPLALTNYQARIATVGPMGVGESDWSNAFSFTGPWTFAVAWGGSLSPPPADPELSVSRPAPVAPGRRLQNRRGWHSHQAVPPETTRWHSRSLLTLRRPLEPPIWMSRPRPSRSLRPAYRVRLRHPRRPYPFRRRAAMAASPSLHQVAALGVPPPMSRGSRQVRPVVVRATSGIPLLGIPHPSRGTAR